MTTDTPSYPAPTAPVDAEIEIKHSRFLAALRPVTTRAEVHAALDRIRAAHPGATHHCYAYLIGPPQSGEAAMSDDGEPSGTAGRPIFTVIGHKDVGDVLIVVTRYFGGVKLGAGGLVRAYMAAAEAVLSQMVVAVRAPMERVTLAGDFADEQVIRHFCGQRGAELLDVRYGQGVEMVIAAGADVIESLTDLCAERRIRIRPTPM